MINKIISKVDKLIRSVIIFATASMLAIICLQIFCRFVLNNALSWPEEASRFLMVWSLFLAAVYALRDSNHIGLSFFVDRIPFRIALIVRLVSNSLIIVFLCVLIMGGVQETISMVPLKTGALRISRAIPYLIMPISGVLFLLVCFRLMMEDIQKLRSE